MKQPDNNNAREAMDAHIEASLDLLDRIGDRLRGMQRQASWHRVGSVSAIRVMLNNILSSIENGL